MTTNGRTKGAGPDDISLAILKRYGSALAPILCVFFHGLLRRGIFPQNLKPEFLIPIHTSGVSSNVQRYRPIIIQSAVEKVFESLVLDILSFIYV